MWTKEMKMKEGKKLGSVESKCIRTTVVGKAQKQGGVFDSSAMVKGRPEVGIRPGASAMEASGL
jgi:hypothetical protein